MVHQSSQHSESISEYAHKRLVHQLDCGILQRNKTIRLNRMSKISYQYLILLLMMVSSPTLAKTEVHRVGSQAVFTFICQRPCDEIFWFVNGVRWTARHQNVQAIVFSPMSTHGSILLVNVSLEMNGSTIKSIPVRNGNLYGSLAMRQNLFVEGEMVVFRSC